MMVGMMVCAVVVVCAEDHNVMRRFSRESVLYPTPAAGVNEFALVSIALVMTLASTPRCFGTLHYRSDSTPLMRSTPASNFSSDVAYERRR